MAARGAEHESDQAEIDAATQKMLEEQIDRTLAVLSDLQIRVIKLRFGLSDGHSYTLAEAGDRLGISQERVREIEMEAIEILRSARPRTEPH
jgi:RNA polymerase primary sigma factor